MNLRAYLLAGSAMTLAAALATPALAQTEAPASAPAADATVGEIVVTANRREQALNDVGMAIQAFGSEQLESLRVTNVQDLSSVAPSFSVSRSYQGVPTFTLRGIGFNTINMSATSTVGTYVDEVAYAYPMMLSGPVFDLERVEVLKGPQGTLYGRNTTAGLINFVTQKPTSDFQARGVAEFGNYETYNFEGMVSGPITDNLQGRIAFRKETSNQGWQKSATRNETLGEVDRYGIRGSLAFQPTDALSIDASVSYWANKSDTLAAQAIGFTPGTTPQAVNPLGAGFHNAPGLPAFVANQKWSNDTADWAPASRRTSTVGGFPGIDKPLEEDSTFLAGKLNIAWDINDDLTLVSLTSLNKIERQGVMDWAGAPYNVLIQDADGEIESFAQEIRLQGGNDRVTWLVGAYYGKDDIVDTNRTLFRDNANVRLFQFLSAQLLGTPYNTGPLPGGQGPGGTYTLAQAQNTFQSYRDDGKIETTTASIFASADWKLSETLSLTTGLRYTQDKQDANVCSRDVNGSMLVNLNLTNKYLYALRYGGVVITDNVVQNGCSTTRIDWDNMTATRGEVITSLDEDNVAWRLALNWNATDDVLLYGSVSQGAKSGGAPVNTASLYEQNLPVQQEKLLSYEVGVKAGLFDRRVQANISAFYYDYTDKQMSTFNPDALYTALARLQNIPESFAYGLDGEVTWRVTDDFTAIGAATFLHTEIDGFVGTNGAGQPQSYDGAAFLYSPEFLGSLTLVYERELNDGLGVKAVLNGRYQKESQADLEGNPLYEIPAYGLLNGSLGVTAKNGAWEASFWGRNLTDEYYWTAVASNANTVVRFPGQPRTYGVSLTLKY